MKQRDADSHVVYDHGSHNTYCRQHKRSKSGSFATVDGREEPASISQLLPPASDDNEEDEDWDLDDDNANNVAASLRHGCCLFPKCIVSLRSTNQITATWQSLRIPFSKFKELTVTF
jgi:hypothetical protein